MPGASFEREPDPGCGNFNERQGNYTPLLSREDYLKGNAKSRKINPVEMMNALLESDGITVEELEKLQELIDKKRAELESR